MKRKLLYLFLFIYSFSQAQCFGSLQSPGYTVLPDGTLWYWGIAGSATGFGFPIGTPTVDMPFNQIGTDSDWSQKYSAASHKLFIKTRWLVTHSISCVLGVAAPWLTNFSRQC